MKKTEEVGIIGLGRMGGPVAQRFMKANIPIAVWETVPEIRKAHEKKKNVRIATPGEMARACRIIFFVVPSSAEIADCLKGNDGILQSARKGLVLYDLTSSDPAETKKLARRAEKKGIAYVDAGMSGGPSGILAGKLTLMMGGDEKVIRKTRKYLNPFVDKTFHLGPTGAGHTMKLVHNMVLHSIFLATCQGAQLIERMGMRVEDMIDVFNVSTAYSYASRFRFPENILSGKWNAKARIYNLHKDVGLAVKLGKKHGADVSLGELTFDFIQKAVARGMIEDDLSLLYRDFEEIRNVRLAKAKTRAAAKGKR
ncbi:MAG: NAD(P)-dependent oxidoreductase [bacterium]|nr:NAD(P)-dependent oxidoreductase [bacterium]